MHQNIKLIVESDYDAMSKKAAIFFAQAVKENPNGSFGFATGSTPIGLYKELVRMYKEGGLDFSGISTYNLDEYYPIARDCEESYFYFMREHLFDHVNVNPNNMFLPDGTAPDSAVESLNYEKKLDDCGGLTVQILGIGMNGHIAFNEPAESFEVNTRLVPLAEETIDVNSKHFPDPADIPHHAITMGIRSIMMSKNILLMANGKAKADIMRDALLGPVTPLVPASILQLHPSVTVILDKEAGCRL